MSAYEQFKKLGYKRKQNNKDYIEYLLVDEDYFNFGETKKDSKMEKHIVFDKARKSIDLKALCYTFNIVQKKQVMWETSFNVNKELLNAINEQFLEIEQNI